MIDKYRNGATANELADQFGLHRQTVSAHLRREDVALHSRVKMTPEIVAKATTLYAEGWSTVRIGEKLGLGPSTVGKALKRAGVRMRPAVAERWHQ
ncbi:hypothetical protein [Antrihabitans spumae]|uniref:Helix-turn-helix domain-containing protein n=1 Tax=Antrihabitans spumae TaxID=3373370 RepID=A0ABW7K701_9NOCA